MNNDPAPRSPRALTAIAAVLALSAIPAAATATATAQEVQAGAPGATPSLSLPQDVTTGSPVEAAQATPAPTPVAPTVTLPPESIAPVAAPDATTTAGTAPQQTTVLPDVAPPAPQARSAGASEPAQARSDTRTPSRSASRAGAETPTATPTVPTAQAAGTARDGALAQGAVPPATPAPARADVPPAAAQAEAQAPAESGSEVPVAGIVGLLAALGVAGLGIAAMRRRREPVYDNVDHAPETLPPATGAGRIEEPAPMTHPATPPKMVSYAMPERATAGSATAVLATAPLPQTADERRDLLDRMVDAEPDQDNPFTSRKGRMRRARIQLQHRESHAQDRIADRQDFDFRTYRPSTRTTTGPLTPAKPDLVDA